MTTTSADAKPEGHPVEVGAVMFEFKRGECACTVRTSGLAEQPSRHSPHPLRQNGQPVKGVLPGVAHLEHCECWGGRCVENDAAPVERRQEGE